jgi:hypothetical protein
MAATASNLKAKAEGRSRPSDTKVYGPYLDRFLQKNYGITSVRYGDMLAEQGGVCAICLRPCRWGRRLAVDHDHKTGVIRELLCASCNTGIGHFGEDVAVMQRAIEYLKRHGVENPAGEILDPAPECEISSSN